MGRLKIAGLCFASAFAVMAVVAGGASAVAPEYGRCVKLEKNAEKKYEGKYTDKGCTKEATAEEQSLGTKNKYEWHPGAVKVHQTSTGGKATLQEVGKYAVGCESESSTGDYVGTKEATHLFVKFKGCKVTPFVCTSPGHPAGELETKELEGRVVWQNKAEHKAALELYPAKGEEKFIAFSCGALTVEVRGAILVPFSKPNKMGTKFTLKYKEKNGFQELRFFEGEEGLVQAELEANFEGKGWAKAGQSITATVFNEEALELNTFV
jgi:hypothetical protein